MASIPLRLFLAPHQRKPAPVLLPHPLKPTFLSPPRLRIRSEKPTIKPISCSFAPAPAVDRLISAASYFFPFFNTLPYGLFLFTKFPIVAAPFEPLFPLFNLYNSFPEVSFVTFFGLLLGVVRNPKFSPYVRFNTLLAVMLDYLRLVTMIITPGTSGIGLMFTVCLHSGLFVFVVSCFIYGLVSSILGKTPYTPFFPEPENLHWD